MASPYIGEIRLFAGNFAPSGWMTCDGQLVAISDNDTLFNLIGTTYGGDGQETFALPDLRGRVPIHMGGIYTLAESGGEETVTLTTSQIPAHPHGVQATSGGATSTSPQGNALAAGNTVVYAASGTAVALAPTALGPNSGGQPHENRMPYLSLTFIISLYGVYPSPN